jgi:hypothetical protein
MELLTEYTAHQAIRDQAVRSQIPYRRRADHPRPARTLRRMVSRIAKR